MSKFVELRDGKRTILVNLSHIVYFFPSDGKTGFVFTRGEYSHVEVMDIPYEEVRKLVTE